LRQTNAPMLAGATAARPLGSQTGVRPGTSPTTVTATTTTVTVQPFAGVADVQTLASAGPYEFAFDAVYSVALTAQSASVPRTDIVYVQINDNQEDGTGAAGSSSATRVYLAGTPTAVLPNSRAFIIAVINVPITGSSPTVTWVAPYTVAAGGQLAVNTASQLPAAGILGDRCIAYDTGIVYRYNGTAWKAWESDWITYTPTLTNFVLGTGGSAASVWKYRYDSGEVKVYYQLTLGTTGASVGSNPTFTLPVAISALAHAYQGIDGRGSIANAGLTSVVSTDMGADNTSTTTFRIYTGGTFSPVTATTPHTWAAGSVAQGEFTFRPA
jgi:hypothetical protein